MKVLERNIYYLLTLQNPRATKYFFLRFEVRTYIYIDLQYIVVLKIFNIIEKNYVVNCLFLSQKFTTKK